MPEEKEKKEKKEKKEESIKTIEITSDQQLLVDGKRKFLKDFETFKTEDKIETGEAINLDGMRKENKMVAFSSIDFKGSARYQPRVNPSDSSFKKLVPSIAESGILQPLLVTINESTEGTFDCLNGFTRGRAIEALINPETLKDEGFENLVIKKEFSYDSLIPVIIYTKEDGSRIDEADCFRISSMANNLLEKWSILDLANNFKSLLENEVRAKLGAKLGNTLIKEHIDNLFTNGTPLVILNGLLHSSILSANEISIVKEKVFNEIKRNTQLSDEEIRNYSRIAEIPREFWNVLTGQRNEWGIVLSPKNAISLFFSTRGQVKTGEAIKKILSALSARTNPSKKGVKKVSGAEASELKEALSENDESKQRVINRTEKEVALMLLGMFMTKGNLNIVELPTILASFTESKNLEDFLNMVSTKTGIKFPKVSKFAFDRKE
jgi:hypothetical protein